MTDYNFVDPVTVLAPDGLMPRPRPMLFATAVKRGRERLGMSQDTAAERVGVRQQTWSGWEKGVSIPPPRRVATIAEVLKLDVAKLQQAAGHIPGVEGLMDDPMMMDEDQRLDNLEARMTDLVGLIAKIDDRLDRIEKDLRRKGR